VYGVVLQTDGATPLFIASQEGRVECVQALLEGGAAANQAMVCCATWMFIILRELCVRGCAGGFMHACAACVVRWDGTRLRIWASSGGVHVGMG
jgi:hypothetical protein